MTPLFDLKNAEMGGTLERRLREWRKKGISYRKISALLSESGRSVHRATVDNWCRQLGL